MHSFRTLNSFQEYHLDENQTLLESVLDSSYLIPYEISRLKLINKEGNKNIQVIYHTLTYEVFYEILSLESDKV